MAQRWPLHPPPYPDESLSSWLERLAHAYAYSVSELLTDGLGVPAFAAADLDRDPPPALMEGLAARTGISVAHVRAMTSGGWVPQLIAGLAPGPYHYDTYMGDHALLYPTALRRRHEFPESIPWLDAGWFERGMACPRCVQEGPEPYRRLIWRLAWMTSCPWHGLLLEEMVVLAGVFVGENAEAAVPAPPELLALDRLTWQAIDTGRVSLPRQRVSGGVWLRLLRALVEELSLPVPRVARYRAMLRSIWQHLGRDMRHGGKSLQAPFELMTLAAQQFLMHAAGTAIEMLMHGTLVGAGSDAMLFVPLSPDAEMVLAGTPHVSPAMELSAYAHAWSKVNATIRDLEEEMHRNPQTAHAIKKLLLGTNATPAHQEDIDRMFRTQGYRLPEDVI